MVADEAGRASDIGLTRAEWLLLLVLAAVQFTHSMDFMVMLPLGAHCREELGITPQQFSWLAAAYGFSAAIAGLLAANFIDRFDRRSALLTLYAGLVAGTLLCAVAPGYWTLMLARSVAGAFGGIVAAFLLVIVGDAFPEARRGRATGVVMTAFSVASIAGLPVGIILGNRYGVRAPFAALGILSLGILAIALRTLPRFRGHLGQRRTSAAETWAVLAQPAHLRAYLFMILLVMGTFTIAPHFSDYLVHNVGRDKNELSYVYLVGGLLTFVTLPWIGRLADRFGKRRLFRIMATLTLLIVLVLTNLPAIALVPLLAVTAIYWISSSGRWVPAMALVTSSALPRYRGSFMSVSASVQQMACGLAAVIAGTVIGEDASGKLTGYSMAGVIAAASTAISMLFVGRLRLPQEKTKPAAAVDTLADPPLPVESVAMASPTAE